MGLIIDRLLDKNPPIHFAAANHVEVIPITKGGNYAGMITGYLNGKRITETRESFFEAYFDGINIWEKSNANS